MKKITRMKVHFDTMDDAYARVNTFWERADGKVALMASVLIDMIWDPEHFDENMEVILTYQPAPAAGGLATARLPAPVGLLRGRIAGLYRSPWLDGRRWLNFQCRFQATEGPEVFLPTQRVQIEGDSTGSKLIAPLLRVDDEVSYGDHHVQMEFGDEE